MKDFIHTARGSLLFLGIAETEIREMLGCLDAKVREFRREEFIFREGDATESMGLLLSGKAFVIQEDFWGNRNIVSTVTEGQTFAETFACAPGAVMTVSVMAEEDCTVLFLNVKRILTTCSSACAHERQAHPERLPLRLHPPQPDHPEPSLRSGCKESGL